MFLIDVDFRCLTGWSKRSHRHSYNASSGVAIILGEHSKKLLFLGTRNKVCAVCRRAETYEKPPPEHKCSKTWDLSSQAMEADILLKGFTEAEQVHGVRYMRVIGDGDSSLLYRLRSDGPAWCRDIIKQECANHAVKGMSCQ